MRPPQALSFLQAVILSGGMGTRLRSVIPDRQKVITDIRDRPFLTYLLDQLSDAGIGTAILCTGHLGEQVRSEIGDSYGRIGIKYSQEQSPLGTAGAVRTALPLLEGDTVLVMNGDSYCEIQLLDFLERYSKQGAHVAIALTRVPDTKRYGRVHLNESGQVISFTEKHEAGGPGWINAGIYLIERSLLETIPQDRPVSMEKEMFPAWIPRGILGYKCRGRFIDIGTPDSYLSAQEFFNSKASL